MQNSSKNREHQILLACEAGSKQEKPNISALAREFGVPRRNLAERIASRQSLYQRPTTNTALDAEQEAALIQCCITVDNMGFPAQFDDIRRSANAILRRSAIPITTRYTPSLQNRAKTRSPASLLANSPANSPANPSTNPSTNPSANSLANSLANEPRTVRKNWVYRFIKRLPPHLQVVRQNPLERNRLEAEDLGVIDQWDDLLDITIQRHNISPRNIWNWDETGFQIGQGSNGQVMSRYKNRHHTSTSTI